MLTLRENLRARFLDLGFDEVRFSAVEKVPSEHLDRFDRWLTEGQQAGMRWIDSSREKRIDINRVLPGARSVIILGVNYLPDDDGARGQKRWAKYALYSDYHDTIKSALVEAGKVLESELGISGADYCCYVDTGPVMERGLAARSGMGWQGKNGMLISRAHGNWLLLASIFARYSIDPDEMLSKEQPTPRNSVTKPCIGQFCGSCTRCIDGCPTGAIRRPGLVDSRLCVSYLTIENKGIIPLELWPAIGGRLYGCDVCLDACPWNRFAKRGRMMLLSRRYDLVELSLADLLRMTREDFRRIFAKTPIKRIKWSGLVRNACVVASNLRAGQTSVEDVEALRPLLARLVDCDEPVVRTHAIWAMQRLWPAEAETVLS